MRFCVEALVTVQPPAGAQAATSMRMCHMQQFWSFTSACNALLAECRVYCIYSTENILSLTALAGMCTTSRSQIPQGPVMSSAAKLVIHSFVTIMVIRMVTVMPT